MKNQAKIFIILTLSLTWITWWLLAYLTQSNIITSDDFLYFILIMIGGASPTVMAYVTVSYSKNETTKDLNKRVFNFKIKIKYYLLALLLPILIVITGQIFNYFFGYFQAINISTEIFRSFFPLFLSSLIMGGIEEVGWRGLLQNELQKKLNLNILNLIISIIWAFWHLPLFFILGRNHYGENFLIYIISCIGMSSFMTFLYYKSKSVIPPIIFHTMINTLSGLGLLVGLSSNSAPLLINSILLIIIGFVLLYKFKE